MIGFIRTMNMIIVIGGLLMACWYFSEYGLIAETSKYSISKESSANWFNVTVSVCIGVGAIYTGVLTEMLVRIYERLSAKAPDSDG
jgi:uncharacterized membrane protein (DUF485 family)